MAVLPAAPACAAASGALACTPASGGEYGLPAPGREKLDGRLEGMKITANITPSPFLNS
jgi:hypothetical protein